MVDKKKELNDHLLAVHSASHFDRPEEKKSTTTVEWLVRAMNVLQSLLIIGIIYTLTTDGDCDKPIRLWIEVLLVCYVFAVLFAGASCLMSLPPLVACIKFLVDVFCIVWYTIGTVWFFQDDFCEEKWYSGYVMAYIVVVFYVLSWVPYLLCCFLICGAIVGAKRNN